MVRAPFSPRLAGNSCDLATVEMALGRGARARKMADDDPDARRLAELEERLQKARGKKEVRRHEAPPSQLGIAFRLVTELLAGVIVGGGIGWALDRVLGTSPFLLIVLFLLGVAAGMRNVIRAASEMNEGQNRPGG
jgi:ATP synthase protein I